MLLEDFGDARMRERLDAEPDARARALRARRSTCSSHLHASRRAGPARRYDLDRVTQREVAAVHRMVLPGGRRSTSTPTAIAAWDEVLAPVARTGQHRSRCCAIIMPRISCCSTDATACSSACSTSRTRWPAIRPTISSRCSRTRGATSRRRSRREMLDRYRRDRRRRRLRAPPIAVLGAQRNAKILGIFTRLWKRDGKPRYLGFQPRVWGYARARPRPSGAGAGRGLVRRQCPGREARGGLARRCRHEPSAQAARAAARSRRQRCPTPRW